MKTKYLVLGHGSHGKGTFCKLVKEVYGLDSTSSSAAAFPHILPTIKSALDIHDKDDDWFYEHRDKNRLLWRDLILLLNTPDRTTLSRIIIDQVPIYDGMRSKEEFEASKDLFDHIIWVDASERLPPDPSMGISYTEDMILIDNNGPESELLRQINYLSDVFESD